MDLQPALHLSLHPSSHRSSPPFRTVLRIVKELARMKIVALICRILLGLMFLVFGLNIFFHFIPMKMPVIDPMTPFSHVPLAMDFNAAVGGTAWMKIVGVCQVLGGLFVLLGGTVPLGLCLLCPVTFNILLFHLCLTGGKEIAPGAFAAMLELVLLYAYRANFAGIFTAKASPVPGVSRT
jgi:putative oxidoreductase